MQISLQQLRRALSAALFVLLLSLAGMKNALAQNQVATLQHNDSITGVFYGQHAFVSAYNAAANGDIITLSSGTFDNCNIAKSITIHGAGCVYDSVTQVMPTIIPGEFFIQHNNVSFEGVWIRGNGVTSYSGPENVSFVKCNLDKIGVAHADNRENWSFVNCIVKDFGGASDCQYIGMTIINSVVRFTKYFHTNVSNPTTIINSIVLFDNSTNNATHMANITANNSIIQTVSGHVITDCSFFNCIGIKLGTSSLFDGITQNVMIVDNYDDVFETFTGTVSYDNNYQLKDEIATSFLGNDGTEVGIYGGIMPYNPRPNYMIIRSCNVAGRTNEDNKLSVEIELLNPDE